MGLHAGINAAAIELAARARVHALGAMVGAPAWTAVAQALAQAGERGVDLGLHLDLTEHPLLRQTRRPLGDWMWRAAWRRIDRKPLRLEIRAQLAAFADGIGRQPDYVDGHQHVHQLPGVRETLLEELAAQAGPRPWLRNSRSRDAGPFGLHNSVKTLIIGLAGARGLATLARAQGWQQNAALLGAYDFGGGIERYRALARAWLHAARDRDLLMCHPSVPSTSHDPLLAARCAEFEYWSSAEPAALVEREAIVLQPMSRIVQPPR